MSDFRIVFGTFAYPLICFVPFCNFKTEKFTPFCRTIKDIIYLHVQFVSSFQNYFWQDSWNTRTLALICYFLVCERQSTLVISTLLISNKRYLEVKIWSLFKHGNLTTDNKIFWKRGKIAPQYFQYTSKRTSGVKLHIHFVKCGSSIYCIP